VTRRDPGEPLWRTWWRRLFGGFLLLTLVGGLWLSYRPAGFTDGPDVAAEDDEKSEPAKDPGPIVIHSEGESEPPDDQASEESDTTMTPEEAEAFIAAARDPAETSVQVLDAGGGSEATDEAADALREAGYDVVAVNTSRADYSVTTVLFTEGNKTEGQALRAREERVADIAPNDRLSDAVDLHVVVASDWSE
jgi:hypothetical protein